MVLKCGAPQRPASKPCTQRPNTQRPNSDLRAIRPTFSAPEAVPERGQKGPASAASTGWRSAHFGTLEGATGGTQTHSRRTGERLGRLQRARQGLVRVPESNTKYGGKAGKTGGHDPFCSGQVSVSPRGFPSEKICVRRHPTGFIPLFTGEVFLWPKALPWEDSRKPTEMSGQPYSPDRGFAPR